MPHRRDEVAVVLLLKDCGRAGKAGGGDDVSEDRAVVVRADGDEVRDDAARRAPVL